MQISLALTPGNPVLQSGGAASGSDVPDKSIVSRSAANIVSRSSAYVVGR